MDQQSKLKRVIEITNELEARKALYDELDKLTLELKSGGFVSADLDNLHAELVDNFANENNVAFRPAAVHRFEIKIETTEKYNKRMAKKAKGA